MTVEIYCHFLGKTDKAIKIHDGTIEAWIPISQIFGWSGCGDFNDLTDSDAGLYLEIEIPEWLADQKELL